MNTKYHIIILYTLIAASITCCILVKQSQKTIAYVDMQTLFSEFKMKQALEKKFEATESVRKSVLDSMMMQLKMIHEELQRKPQDQQLINIYNEGKQQYLKSEATIKEDNERQVAEYDKQIWKQLNQYVSDYGKEQNLDIILGADGTGNLMFAQEGMNITDPLKIYVNGRYEGK